MLLVENNKIVLFLFHGSLYFFCYIGRKETPWSYEPRCRAGRRGRPPLWYCSPRFIEVFLLRNGLAILYGLVLSFSNVALMFWLSNSPKGRKAKDPIYTSTKLVLHRVKLDNIYWLFNQSKSHELSIILQARSKEFITNKDLENCKTIFLVAFVLWMKKKKFPNKLAEETGPHHHSSHHQNYSPSAK